MYKIYWQLKGYEGDHFLSVPLSVEFVLTYIGKLMEDKRVHSLGVIKYENKAR